jgi:hypothetical protein
MLELTNLENANWEAHVGPDINDPPADAYHIVQYNQALSLTMCSAKPYSGWLAKHVEPLYIEAGIFRFKFTLMIDDATLACAQVAETDVKITDDDSYTYDFSAQLNLAKGWLFQVDQYIENPDGTWKWTWADTNVQIPALKPYWEYHFEIEHLADYTKKSSAISALIVDGKRYDIVPQIWIPAKKVGWAPGEAVFQLQQCNNASPGGYTLRFNDIGYVFDER